MDDSGAPPSPKEGPLVSKMPGDDDSDCVNEPEENIMEAGVEEDDDYVKSLFADSDKLVAGLMNRVKIDEARAKVLIEHDILYPACKTTMLECRLEGEDGLRKMQRRVVSDYQLFCGVPRRQKKRIARDSLLGTMLFAAFTKALILETDGEDLDHLRQLVLETWDEPCTFAAVAELCGASGGLSAERKHWRKFSASLRQIGLPWVFAVTNILVELQKDGFTNGAAIALRGLDVKIKGEELDFPLTIPGSESTTAGTLPMKFWVVDDMLFHAASADKASGTSGGGVSTQPDASGTASAVPAAVVAESGPGPTLTAAPDKVTGGAGNGAVTISVKSSSGLNTTDGRLPPDPGCVAPGQRALGEPGHPGNGEPELKRVKIGGVDPIDTSFNAGVYSSTKPAMLSFLCFDPGLGGALSGAVGVHKALRFLSDNLDDRGTLALSVPWCLSDRTMLTDLAKSVGLVLEDSPAASLYLGVVGECAPNISVLAHKSSNFVCNGGDAESKDSPGETRSESLLGHGSPSEQHVSCGTTLRRSVAEYLIRRFSNANDSVLVCSADKQADLTRILLREGREVVALVGDPSKTAEVSALLTSMPTVL